MSAPELLPKETDGGLRERFRALASSGPYAILVGRAVTCDPARATAGDPLGVIERSAVVVDGAAISVVCGEDELRRDLPDVPVVLRATTSVLTPGLCDAHTHAPSIGSRDAEYALRMAGACSD